MKIVLINGSPKAQHSSSGNLAKKLEGYFSKKCTVETITLHRGTVSTEAVRTINDADAAVFLFPLYFDSVPSHLVACFEQLEKSLKPSLRVYGLVNCGFFEGVQTSPAFEVLENWCLRAGVQFCGGMGVGGGGVLSMMPALEDKNFTKFGVLADMRVMARAIGKGKNYGVKYTSVTMPRLFYRVGADACWRWLILKNGKRIRDLGKSY